MTDDLLEYKHELIERVHTAIQKQVKAALKC